MDRDQAGFCTNHRGIITSKDEVNKIVAKTFPSNILQKLKDVLYNIIIDLSKKLNSYEIKRSSELVGKITDTMSFLNQISIANSAIMHLVVDLFELNIPMKTSHKCFQFYEEDGQLIVNHFTTEKVSENSQELKEHVCKCSVLQNIIRTWNKQFDLVINIGNIFINFLQSYKFKFLCGYSYIALFDIILENESEKLKSISVQIITIEEISIKIVSCKGYGFMEELFSNVYDLINDNLPKLSSKVASRNLFKTIIEFRQDMFYLIKEKTSVILGKNVNV